MPQVIESRLIEEFRDKESFTRGELLEFFRYFEPELKEGTFGWRIHDLKNKNVIKPIKRGFYVISYKPQYEPGISPYLIKVAKQITERFEEIKYCIWETAWLNEFTRHQAGRSILFIEVERGYEESFFYELKDLTRKEVFLNPDEKTIEYYVAESNQPIIIKKLLTRAPLTPRTEKKIKFHTPTLEKILVDLYTDERLFYQFKGSELIHIFENAINNYTTNFTKLFSYARRREREKEIRQFMINHMSHLLKGIIDD